MNPDTVPVDRASLDIQPTKEQLAAAPVLAAPSGQISDDGPNQRFAFVDPNSGQIMLSGSCRPHDVDRQNPPKGLVLLVVDESVRSGTHKMDLNGQNQYPVAVPLTQQDLDDRVANDPVTKYFAAQAAAAAAVASP